MKRYTVTVTTKATVVAPSKEGAKDKVVSVIAQANQFLSSDEVISPEINKMKIKKLVF